MIPPERVAALCNGRRAGEGQWIGHCPAHDDRKASLSIALGANGQPVVFCHAGCDQSAVLAAFKVTHGLDLRAASGNAKGRRQARRPANSKDSTMEIRTLGTGRTGSDSDPETFTPVVPPREEPSPDEIRHRRYGAPAAVFCYFDAAGRLEGLVRRFNLVGADGARDKVFLPLRFGHWKGRLAWHPKGWQSGRPLYRLPQLLRALDGPVLVLEGEGTADAAAQLFQHFPAVAPMNGCLSPAKTDWSPLRGRHVLIWPDNDAPGAKFAEAVARLTTFAGAASVAIVQIPDSFPAKWDLADAPPPGADLRALLDAAEPWGRGEARSAEGKPPDDVDGRELASYRMCETGLFYLPDSEKPAVRLSGSFEVLAETRGSTGDSWGLLLRWRDRDSTQHEWAMPRSALAGDAFALREQLLNRGLFVSPSRFAREKLALYLAAVQVPERARSVEAVGWHGAIYVTSRGAYGSGERVILQGFQRPPAFEIRGERAAWQREVAAVAEGNSRLAFALSAAFAGPLLRLVGEESYGFHFYGRSSIGKTLALRLAGSVWGRPFDSWRTTDNAAELLAASSNDGLLLLDELSQADGRAADALAYMLANGGGKTRMRRDGTARAAIRWQLLFISSGEVGLSEKLAERGRPARAGQAVRMIEIPAEVGPFGVFETLHGAEDGQAFATALKAACERHAGHAADQFLSELVRNAAAATLWVTETRQQWLEKHLPAGADGQVARVAAKFALAAAAGELAADFGVLPWPRDVGSDAAAACFKAWLARRGTVGPSELEEGIQRVRLFIEQHGASRFTCGDEVLHTAFAADERTAIRAGYRKRNSAGSWDFLVFPETWKRELCRGFDATAIARAMVARGLMTPGPDGKLTRSERAPGATTTARFYFVNASILGGAGQ